MDTVTITKDWRITIPRECRELLGIRPGQKVDVTVSKGGIISLEFLPFEGEASAPGRAASSDHQPKRGAPKTPRPGGEVAARP